MNPVYISEFESGFVLHFAVEDKRINAYTLASTLTALADAAKAANSNINPGHEIEILVEALGPGSFRAMIRAVYDTAHNLFSSQDVRAIVLGIVASFIYERALSVHHDIRIEVSTDEVVIQHENEKVIVPRVVYDETRRLGCNSNFSMAIDRALLSASTDGRMSGIALVPRLDSPEPEFLISRDTLSQIEPTVHDLGDERIVEENSDLQIVKAILERNKRKWEFRWRGVKISAPVTDQQFYSEFFAHNIRIAPGDELKVRLAIHQSKDAETGIYTNIGYEVVRVFEHIPRIHQQSLSDHLK